MTNFLKSLQNWAWHRLEWLNLFAGIWAIVWLVISYTSSSDGGRGWWVLWLSWLALLGIAFANFYMAWKVRVTRSGRSVRWDVCRECDHLKEMHVNGISNWSEYTGVTKDVLRCAVMTQMKFTVPYHFQSCQCEQYRRRWIPMAWPARESVK